MFWYDGTRVARDYGKRIIQSRRLRVPALATGLYANLAK